MMITITAKTLIPHYTVDSLDADGIKVTHYKGGSSKVEHKYTAEVKDSFIVDQTHPDESGDVCLSSVSVCVTVDVAVDGGPSQEYTLDFQTGTTFDAGAISYDLDSYDENSEHEELASKIPCQALWVMLSAIKLEVDVNRQWHDYVTENFTLSDDSNYMDANSHSDKAKVKS